MKYIIIIISVFIIDFNATAQGTSCYDSEMDIKYVKLQFHFMNFAGCHNCFDGNNNPIERAKAVEYAKNIVDHANHYLCENKKMLLPVGNITPNLHTKFRYILSPNEFDESDVGVYFHHDNDYGYFLSDTTGGIPARDIFDYTCNTLYGNNTGEVINVFIREYHPIVQQTATQHMMMYGVGPFRGNYVGMIALGNAYTRHYEGIDNSRNIYHASPLLNHELGHVYTLIHAWGQFNLDDGCDDTPFNQNNCWSFPNNSGNNVMDDHSCGMNAYTPCQINKMHCTMDNEYIAQKYSIYDFDCPVESIISHEVYETINQGVFRADVINSTATLYTEIYNVNYRAREEIYLNPGFEATAFLGHAHISVGHPCTVDISPNDEMCGSADPYSESSSMRLSNFSASTETLPFKCYHDGDKNIHHIHNTLELYPNPASNIINVKTENDIVTIALYDVVGIEVYSRNYLNEDNSKLIEIDLTAFKQGIYALKVVLSNDRVLSERLVINK